MLNFIQINLQDKVMRRCAYFPLIVVICLASSQIFHVTANSEYNKGTRGKVGFPDTKPTFPEIKRLQNPDKLRQIDEQFSKCNGIDIRELTISQVQGYFATNRLSSAALTTCYIQRINQMNPYLNAVIEINPDALKIARDADLERIKGKSSGSMLGIPILLIDSIGTKDKMECTSGSLALIGKRPVRDAATVSALRKAGAVILGKSNLSEFDCERGTNIPAGWSGRGGQTINPYNQSTTPEGSSSGSASSVATNLAMVSLGTENDGCLLGPSSVQSLFTIKPTLGTPSTQGYIPLSHTQDCIGPIARTSLDLAIVLDSLIPQTTPLACGSSFAQCLAGPPQQPLRVGIYRDPYWNPDAISNCAFLSDELPALENMLTAMKGSSSFEIVDPVSAPYELLGQVSVTNENLVILQEFKYDLDQYLGTEAINDSPPPSNQILTLADIIKYNNLHPNPEGFNQELFIQSQATNGLANQTYLNAREHNIRVSQELINGMFVKLKLDAVVTPSEHRCGYFVDPILWDAPRTAFSLPAIAGYPSLNVPVGIGPDGVPFGATIFGLPHTEAKLLQIAHAVEQLTPGRQPPSFLI